MADGCGTGCGCGHGARGVAIGVPPATPPPVSPAAVERALEGVLDPELGLSVIALGMIYGIDVDGATARIRMTLTAQGCPLHEVMVAGVHAAAMAVPGLERADVEVVFDPPWTPDRINGARRTP